MRMRNALRPLGPTLLTVAECVSQLWPLAAQLPYPWCAPASSVLWDEEGLCCEGIGLQADTPCTRRGMQVHMQAGWADAPIEQEGMHAKQKVCIP